jgi:hypothetical protein
MNQELMSESLTVNNQVLRKKIAILNAAIKCLEEQGRSIPQSVIDKKKSLEEELAKLNSSN